MEWYERFVYHAQSIKLNYFRDVSDRYEISIFRTGYVLPGNQRGLVFWTELSW